MNEAAKPRLFLVCETCGSENLTFTANAEWDAELQRFKVVDDVLDDAYCNDCDAETRADEVVQ